MHKLCEIPSITLFLCAFCVFLWLKNPFNLRNMRLINDLRVDIVLYNRREIFTDVMSALQIHLFLQNKPNFRKSQMNISDYITREYEQMDTWSSGKNKPKQTQSKDLAPASCKNKTMAGSSNQNHSYLPKCTQPVIRPPIQRQWHYPEQSDTASTPRPPA
jgi:hypothetical protein